jgi:Secretion system C-terminal sorting domain
MKKLLTSVLLFCIGLPVFATHIKGGEISISPVAGKPLTYDFTVTIYSEINRANADQKDVFLCFGNGESKNAPRVNGNGEDIGNNVSKSVYKITYTYSGNITNYTVSVSIANRSPDIRNISGVPSVATTFYIETKFNTAINNTTPILTNTVGVIKAKANQKFIYNPKAIDNEGDSLAYRLITVRAGETDICPSTSRELTGFKQPNDVNKVGTFKIDAKMGDLVWTAPTEIGTFVCAFVVEEWRKGVKISETVRDMEIQVADGDGTSIIIPPYEPAGTLFIPTVVLGSETTFDERDLEVFPNPTNAKTVAQISTDKPFKATFQLFDKLIKTISQDDLKTTHTQEFDLQNLTSGTLILQVESGNKIYTRKIIKN